MNAKQQVQQLREELTQKIKGLASNLPEPVNFVKPFLILVPQDWDRLDEMVDSVAYGITPEGKIMHRTSTEEGEVLVEELDLHIIAHISDLMSSNEFLNHYNNNNNETN